MTPGQQRAARELRRMEALGQGDFEITVPPTILDPNSGVMVASVSIRIGAIPSTVDGLPLRDREDFQLIVPCDFPFSVPSITVSHRRFQGFPHVIWGRTLCLYQSPAVEWNPSAGLYGFFDRLAQWLGKASINDMDPVEGPLEPPHHDTDFSHVPFLIRADAPCQAGESWQGLAVLEKHDNRIELLRWHDPSNGWPTERKLGFAVILPDRLPMEFPVKGADLFAALARAGMSERSILENLAIAAHLAEDEQPLYLFIGLPMRRANDGTQRVHIAVWSIAAEVTSSLRSLSRKTDTQEIATFTDEILGKLIEIFKKYAVSWCQVLEDRPEIVVRRDKGTPMEAIRGKKIAILGCGAIGSWVAEMVARADASEIHLIDNGRVKPGLIARQNFSYDDIGAPKALALAARLRSITFQQVIHPHVAEAFKFITSDPERFDNFDLVIDCTASSVFQMKLERSWSDLGGKTPRIISIIINARANHSISVAVRRNSNDGIWSSYLATKISLCKSGCAPDIVETFYSPRAGKTLFQPEPGCSDPTFVGSMADVTCLAARALNRSLQTFDEPKGNWGIIDSALSTCGRSASALIELPDYIESTTGNYKVRITRSIFNKARSWSLKSQRERDYEYETGGLLWGHWDDAISCIWITDLSGPPADSVHNPAHFLCGIEGTADDQTKRITETHGAEGFLGYWHTHPGLDSIQSGTDMVSMAKLVAATGGNQNRAVMLIFGKADGKSTAGLYIYESEEIIGTLGDRVAVGVAQLKLDIEIV